VVAADRRVLEPQVGLGACPALSPDRTVRVARSGETWVGTAIVFSVARVRLVSSPSQPSSIGVPGGTRTVAGGSSDASGETRLMVILGGRFVSPPTSIGTVG
jgi:hypothetical protein